MSDGPNATSGDCLSALGDRYAPVTGVFVQPDDGYAPVMDEITSARCTIDLNMYMLTDDEIFASLIAAQERGVSVRVILEQHPFGMFGDQQEAYERLSEAGIAVRWEPGTFQFSHAKYMIVDQRTAVIMNQNFTGSAFNSNREFGVITTKATEVEQLQSIFDADWMESPTDDIDGPLLVSPDNSRDRLVTFIDGADFSIDFYAEIIRDEEILDALEDAVQRGVTVRLIMNASLDPEDEDSIAELADGGVEVRLMSGLYIHSKTMIVDGDQALIGSINYSMTSLDRNREIAMLLDDPSLLTRINSVFERDWVRAVPAGLTGIAFRALQPLDMSVVNAYSVRTVPKGWEVDFYQPVTRSADIAAGLCSIPNRPRWTEGERYALRGVVSKRFRTR